MSTVTGRVARGVALLDERDPGWLERIDLSTLNMRCNCIVHQVSDGNRSFFMGLRDFGLDEEAAVSHGFWWDVDDLTDDEIDADIQALDAEWRRVIEARRAAS
jgi:hypothetical protein